MSRSVLAKINNDQSVEVVYKKHTGEEFPTTTRLGENLLDVMVNNKLVDELQPGFGACEGTLACSTCHLIFSEEDYKKLEEPTDEDLAYGLTETSRLGCQIKMEKELDGIIVNDISEPSLLYYNLTQKVCSFYL